MKWLLEQIPYVRRLRVERDELERLYKTQYPPGHFYSPVVSKESISSRSSEIFMDFSRELQGIDLREEQQLALLGEIQSMYSSIPFSEKKSDGFRYYYDNGYYCHSDGIFLHLLLRHFRPRRVIEIGSGFSSALILDTDDHWLEGKLEVTFIEPYPDRLFSLMTPADRNRHTVIVDNLERVDLKVFSQLEENDLLFIDSTHVCKTGSDVHQYLFRILPSLKSGVLIHIHDIFYPFEYPQEWVLNWKGFGWNESYALRAFLMNNSDFEIVMFNTFLQIFHQKWFEQNMPTCLTNTGASIWLRKR